VFTGYEIAYVRSQPLGRLATVSADGQPDAVSLAFEFAGVRLGRGSGRVSPAPANPQRPSRERDGAPSQRTLVFLNPFIGRSIRIYGHVDQQIERDGMVGPAVYMKLTPTTLWLEHGRRTRRRDGYAPERTVHQIPTAPRSDKPAAGK